MYWPKEYEEDLLSLWLHDMRYDYEATDTVVSIERNGNK
jgi:hypothetical protein